MYHCMPAVMQRIMVPMAASVQPLNTFNVGQYTGHAVNTTFLVTISVWNIPSCILNKEISYCFSITLNGVTYLIAKGHINLLDRPFLIHLLQNFNANGWILSLFLLNVFLMYFQLFLLSTKYQKYNNLDVGMKKLITINFIWPNAHLSIYVHMYYFHMYDLHRNVISQYTHLTDRQSSMNISCVPQAHEHYRK